MKCVFIVILRQVLQLIFLQKKKNLQRDIRSVLFNNCRSMVNTALYRDQWLPNCRKLSPTTDDHRTVRSATTALRQRNKQRATLRRSWVDSGFISWYVGWVLTLWVGAGALCDPGRLCTGGSSLCVPLRCSPTPGSACHSTTRSNIKRSVRCRSWCWLLCMGAVCKE